MTNDELKAWAALGPWIAEKPSISTRIVDAAGSYIAQVRGWGELTGKGHDARGLSADKAIAIQQERQAAIAAAPTLAAEVLKARQEIEWLRKVIYDAAFRCEGLEGVFRKAQNMPTAEQIANTFGKIASELDQALKGQGHDAPDHI
jgi:hypothetical protein